MLRYSQIGILLFALTQYKDLCAGFHRGYTVSSAALPRPLVVLSERLQEQRTVGFYGVRCAASQVNLPRIQRSFTHGTKSKYTVYRAGTDRKNLKNLITNVIHLCKINLLNLII